MIKVIRVIYSLRVYSGASLYQTPMGDVTLRLQFVRDWSKPLAGPH